MIVTVTIMVNVSSAWNAAVVTGGRRIWPDGRDSQLGLFHVVYFYWRYLFRYDFLHRLFATTSVSRKQKTRIFARDLREYFLDKDTNQKALL